MTDTGSIQWEIRRRITNKGNMASQKCGDKLQNLQEAEDSFAFLALFFLILETSTQNEVLLNNKVSRI